MKLRAAFLGLLLTAQASAASAVMILHPPPEVSDAHFYLPPGQCTDLIVMTIRQGNDQAAASEGVCVGDVRTFFFTDRGTITSFNLFGVVPADSPDVVGRQTVGLLDAWWTVGGAYAGSIFPDGATNYVAIVGIPEPRGWAMLLAGLGVLGHALRRSRRSSRVGPTVVGRA